MDMDCDYVLIFETQDLLDEFECAEFETVLERERTDLHATMHYCYYCVLCIIS